MCCPRIICALGFAAQGHFQRRFAVDLNSLAVRAGVARPDKEGGSWRLTYVGASASTWSTTPMKLETGLPLAQDGPPERTTRMSTNRNGGTLLASRYEYQEEWRPVHPGALAPTRRRSSAVAEPTTLIIRKRDPTRFPSARR